MPDSSASPVHQHEGFKITPDPSASPVYQHEALKNSSTQFRLLEILEGDFGKQVVCTVTTWSIGNAPPYVALSYTWGEKQHPAQIIMNGENMFVRHNCEYTLQQAFTSKMGKYYWIDALCINQHSNAEKGSQVAIMSDIYRNSACVLACVGPHENDSEFLYKIFDKKRSLLMEIQSRTTDFNPSEWDFYSQKEDYEDQRFMRRLTRRCALGTASSTRLRLVGAFLAFMKRPYFTRVWMLQELHLAPQAYLRCGGDTKTFDHLLATSKLLSCWIQASWLANYHGYWLFPFHLLSQLRVTRKLTEKLSPHALHIRRLTICDQFSALFRETMPQRHCISHASTGHGLDDLGKVVMMMKDFQCTDNRDKLYGGLALIDWRDIPAILPDYQKGTFEVAMEISRRFLDYSTCAPDVGNEIVWAREVAHIFLAGPRSLAMATAIRTRYSRSVVPKLLLAELAPTSESPSPALCLEWCGVPICGGANETPVAPVNARGNSPVVHLLEAQDFLTLTNAEGREIGSAPKSTKPGDWLLINSSELYLGDSGPTIIARPTDCGCFSLVGQPNLWHMEGKKLVASLRGSPCYREFAISWHPEDLLLFAWSGLHREAYTPGPGLIADWLDLGICGREGSSYAVEIEEELWRIRQDLPMVLKWQ